MSRDAAISSDGVYRYNLTRRMGSGGDGMVNFIMLNPSTADALVDDATIRKCEKFALRWGYPQLIVTNLFALRSTDPKQLKQHPRPIGPDNEIYVMDALYRSQLHVAAWGNHGLFNDMGNRMRQYVESRGFTLHHLGLTKQKQPWHPLYVRDQKDLEKWI
jgi:hypothetical protein